MTFCNNMCCHSCNGSQEPFFYKTCSASHVKGVIRLPPDSYYPSLARQISRFVSNRAYLGSFGMSSWASNEFERTRGKIIVNREQIVSRHHTELLCLNADRIVSCIHAREY
ncbi:transposable element Tcb1 transposase [Trichonephila clavipes]|nr:transposable element Tcb1 transposase [Trichonephila clavipes]